MLLAVALITLLIFDGVASRTAICVTGEFRSFLHILSNLRDMKNYAASVTKSGVDIFIYMSLKDTGKGGKLMHGADELKQVKDVLAPVRINLYIYSRHHQSSNNTLYRLGKCDSYLHNLLKFLRYNTLPRPQK